MLGRRNWLRKAGAESAELGACLEATGIYGEALLRWLFKAGVAAARVNPAQIKHYARSFLARNKTDRLDAAIIAEFGRERFASGKKLHALPMRLDKLPDGAMVQAGEESFLIAGGKPLRWSFAGYRKVEGLTGEAMLITPPSTVRALVAGFHPALHPSATAPVRG